MNVNYKHLLAMATAASLLVAASTPAQVSVQPQDPATYYALQIRGSVGGHGQVGQLFIGGGDPHVPVAIMIGLDQVFAPLPGLATLRVDPLAIYIVGGFDDNGEYRLQAIGDPILEPLRFYVQALSVKETRPDLFRTSELLSIYTNFAFFWEFKNLD